MTFPRPDFQKVLLSHLPPSYNVHCSKTFQSYTKNQDQSITLRFKDGTETKCDVLIGADGLKSAVRKCLLEEMAQHAQDEGKLSVAGDLRAMVEPFWSGTNTYRALAPGDLLRAKLPNHRALTQMTHVRLPSSLRHSD